MKIVTFTLLIAVSTVQYQQVNCIIPADINGQIINLIVKKIGTLLSLKQPILPKIITAINPKISKIFRAKQSQQNVATTVSTNFVDSTIPVENYPPPAPPAAEYGAPPPTVEYGAPPPSVEYGAPPPSIEYGAPPPPPPVVYGIAPSPPSQDYGLGPA